MKKYLLLFALLLNLGLIAQQKKVVMLQAGNKVTEILSPADIYHFPQFTEGKVFFKDGTKSSGKLNFNTLVNEIQFIDANGNTVSVADEKNIEFVAIKDDLFYYDKGYVRLVSGNSQAKLAVSNVWRVGEKRQGNVYNTTSAASSTNSLTSYFVYGKLQDLVVNQDVELIKQEQYFFSDKTNRTLPANRKNLLALFPKERSRIETYLNENKINFGNPEDLKNIIAFLGRPV